jgi:amino acid adenylation domain-containing protein
MESILLHNNLDAKSLMSAITSSVPQSERSIHWLFEEQVMKTPDATAVTFDKSNITYKELNQRANQLAHYLRKQELPPETLVAICTERGIEMVVAILGVLKAGCAYVPLDPNYPIGRLSYMLEDSKAPFLLLSKLSLKSLFTDYKGKIVELKRNNHEIKSQSKYNLDFSVPAGNLAYVMYTSGTTGNPKGVCIEHRSLNNHMTWMNYTYHFTKNDVFLQKTPFSFDASVWEFFAPLLCGGQLIMAPDQAHADPAQLIKLIMKYNVTVIQLVPVMLREVLEQDNIKLCHSLRQVFCGGEALLPDTIRLFFKKFPALQLHNLYGPTEATIDATTISYDGNTEITDTILIGQPIANTEVYVLNDQLQECPIGEIGELYIGGAGLARGYLNQGELTKAKFIESPFAHQSSRLYKTGDLVRWLPEGNLEYIGRSDDQIKIGGCRVEIGEVEAYILQFEPIHQCAVKVQVHSNSLKFLVAYLVLKEGYEFSYKALHTFLSGVLPEHAIPNRYFALDKLPITPNGKIDRRSLPEIDQCPATVKLNYIPPKDIEEQTLVSIWESVLGLKQIGMNDNFFDLGGHSLSALRILSLIKNAFSVKMGPSSLLKAPTISELVTVIRAARQSAKDPEANSEEDSYVITLKSGAFKLPLFLIHPVGGTIFWYKRLSRYLGNDQPVYAIQDPGIDMQELLFANLEEMASFYLEAIQKIQPCGPYFIAGASFGATVSVEIAKQLEEKGETIKFIGLMDGCAHYPKKFADNVFFENLMRSQYEGMHLQFLSQGIIDTDFLLKLQSHRKEMLLNYKIPNLNSQLTLFKAMELWPVFRELKKIPYYGWETYSTKEVQVYTVPGNHETMFWEPHVQVLANRINNCLSKFDEKEKKLRSDRVRQSQTKIS